MPGRHPDRYEIASPIEHLPTGLPITALHGAADQTVNPDQRRNYVDAATEAGDPATLRLLDGVGHGDCAEPFEAPGEPRSGCGGVVATRPDTAH